MKSKRGSMALAVLLVAAGAGCGGAPPRPEPPPAVDPPPSLGVRCGVEDDVRPGRELVDDVLLEVVQPTPPFDSAAASDAFAACAWAAHDGDEGEFALAYATRADGTVATAGPSNGRVFTPLARCAAEVMCHQGPLVAGHGELRLRVTLRTRPLEMARVRVLQQSATPFAVDLIVTRANEAAAACAAKARLVPPARMSLSLGVHTGRSLASLRREGRVVRVTTDENRGVPDATAACVIEQLSSIAWGDKHAPAGASQVSLEVSWGNEPAPAHQSRRPRVR